jgi:hypothetical protein
MAYKKLGAIALATVALTFVLPHAQAADFVTSERPEDKVNNDNTFFCVQDLRSSDQGFVLNGDVGAVNSRAISSGEAVAAHNWCKNYVAEQTRALGYDVMACLSSDRGMRSVMSTPGVTLPSGLFVYKTWTKEQRDAAVAPCQRQVADEAAKAAASAAAEWKRRHEEQQNQAIAIAGLCFLGLSLLTLIMKFRRRIVRGLYDLLIGSIVAGMRGRRLVLRFASKAIKEAEDRLEIRH